MSEIVYDRSGVFSAFCGNVDNQANLISARFISSFKSKNVTSFLDWKDLLEWLRIFFFFYNYHLRFDV